MNANFDMCHLDAPAIDCGEDNASMPSPAVNERPSLEVHALEMFRKDPKFLNVPFQSILNHGTESPMLTNILPGNMLGLEMVDDSEVYFSHFSTKREAVDDVDGTPCGPTLSEVHSQTSISKSTNNDKPGSQITWNSPCPSGTRVATSTGLSLHSCLKRSTSSIFTDSPLSLCQTPSPHHTSPSKSVRFNALVAAATYDPNNFVDNMENHLISKGIIESHEGDMSCNTAQLPFAFDRQLDVDRDELPSAPLNRALETGLKSPSKPNVEMPSIEHLPPIGLYPSPTREERNAGVIFVPAGVESLGVNHVLSHMRGYRRRSEKETRKRVCNEMTKTGSSGDPLTDRIEAELKKALMELYETHAARAGPSSLFAGDAGAYVDIHGEYEDWVPVDSGNDGKVVGEGGPAVESHKGNSVEGDVEDLGSEDDCVMVENLCTNETEVVLTGRLNQLSSVLKGVGGAFWL